MSVDIHRLDEVKNLPTRADEYQPSSTFINLINLYQPYQPHQPHQPYQPKSLKAG